MSRTGCSGAIDGMNTRLIRLCICTMAVPLTLAACGGGSAKVSTSGSSATSAPAANGGGSSTSAFTACLKQHGVTLPAGLGGGRGGPGAAAPGGGLPPGGSGGPPGGFPGAGGGGAGGAGLSSAQQSAFSACRSKLPAGGFGGGRGFAGGASASQLKAYSSCLSDNGVKVPTSTSTAAAGGSGRRFGNPIAGLRSDPHFAAASKKCAALLPSRGTGSPAPAAG